MMQDYRLKSNSENELSGDVLDPTNSVKSSPYITITVIAVFLGADLIWRIRGELVPFLMFGSEYDFLDVTVFIRMFPFILLPTAIIFLLLRKKLGWILSLFYTFYLSLTAARSTVVNIMREPIDDTMGLHRQVTPVWVYAVVLLIFFGLVWTLCKSNIRASFNVGITTVLFTMGASLVFSLVIAYLLVTWQPPS